jgi:hypothetical protein
MLWALSWTSWLMDTKIKIWGVFRYTNVFIISPAVSLGSDKPFSGDT